jgi:hypothetical protein
MQAGRRSEVGLGAAALFPGKLIPCVSVIVRAIIFKERELVKEEGISWGIFLTATNIIYIE